MSIQLTPRYCTIKSVTGLSLSLVYILFSCNEIASVVVKNPVYSRNKQHHLLDNNPKGHNHA